jgi:ankyrin repeat protein
MKALIQTGNVNTRDKLGKTALIRAVEKGDAEVAALLLEAGADVAAKRPELFARFSEHKTALHTAEANKHFEVDGLLRLAEAEAKAAIDAAVAASDSQPLAVFSCAGLSSQLLLVAKNDRAEVVKLLLEAVADIEAKDENGTTALIWAAVKDYAEVDKVLLAARADVGAKSDRSQMGRDGLFIGPPATAMQCAEDKKHPEVAGVLREAEAKAKTAN